MLCPLDGWKAGTPSRRTLIYGLWLKLVCVNAPLPVVYSDIARTFARNKVQINKRRA